MHNCLSHFWAKLYLPISTIVLLFSCFPKTLKYNCNRLTKCTEVNATHSVGPLSTEVCQALNVTVIPGPVVMVPEKDNLTLSCLVSQRKRSGSVLILRWFFSPLDAAAQVVPSPPVLQPNQFLIVKTGIKKLKLYGNYTRCFPRLKFQLYEETEGEVFRLSVRDVMAADQGFYSCRVQEIRKFRNTWRASSNGSSTTQLTGGPHTNFSRQFEWEKNAAVCLQNMVKFKKKQILG